MATPSVTRSMVDAAGESQPLHFTSLDRVHDRLDPERDLATHRDRRQPLADRAHRIGQDKPVMVYRMVARDTVEERILELQARKRRLADAALADAGGAAAITRDDLLALLA